MKSSKDDVERLLVDMRAAISDKKYVFIQREKNMRTLASLGLRLSDVMDELITLSYSEYIKGPEIDRDRPASDKLWVFKKRIDGETIYIKFKVEYQTDGGVLLLSFHIDESI